MYFVGFLQVSVGPVSENHAYNVYSWFKKHTKLKVAYVCSENSPPKDKKDEYGIEDFEGLNKDQALLALKNQYEIIIFNVDPLLNSEIYPWFVLFDKLFVFGEENFKLAEVIQEFVSLSRNYNEEDRKLFDSFHNGGAYVLSREVQKIGYALGEKNIEKITSLIFNDYLVHQVSRKTMNNQSNLSNQLNGKDQGELRATLVKQGVPYEKVVLFEKYVLLRQLEGQEYSQAVSSLAEVLYRQSYEDMTTMFNQELQMAQIKFEIEEADVSVDESKIDEDV